MLPIFVPLKSIIAFPFFGLIVTVLSANPSPWNSAYSLNTAMPFLIFVFFPNVSEMLGRFMINLPVL